MTAGATMSALSRASVSVTAAAAMIVVAHLLGPAGLGAYAAAQTLIAVLLVVTTVGIEHGIVYYVSSGRWKAVAAFRCSQRLALGSGLAGAVAAIVLRLTLPGAFHGLSLLVTAVAAMSLPFALSWLYGAYVALAIDRYEAFALPWAVQSGLALCLVAGLAAFYGVGGAVLGVAVSHVITCGIRLRPGRRLAMASHGSPEQDGSPLRQAVGFGIKGYLANSLQALNYRLDLLILNAFAAGAAVGHYAVAVAVTSLVWLLPQALGDVLYPRVAAIRSSGGEAREELLRFSEAKAVRHAAIATVAVSLIVVLGLYVCVRPMFGAAFGSTIELGLILLPGVMLLAMANPLSAAVVARGRPGLMLRATLTVTPPTIALYAVLIPVLHAIGAALASSISYAAMFLVVAAFYRRLTHTNPFRLIVPSRSELDDYRALAARVWSMRSKARFA